MKNDDERLDLTTLRSEVPLRDSDYAAIRARVRAELAKRGTRQWFPLWLRVAVTAVVVVAIAALLIAPRNDGADIAAEAPAAVIRTAPAPVPQIAAAEKSSPAPLPPPARTYEEKRIPAAETATPTERAPSRRPVRQPAPEPVQIATAEPMRIEMHTEDPDVRIIWIVQPIAETKENS